MLIVEDSTAKTLLHRIGANEDLNTIESITISDKIDTAFSNLTNMQDKSIAIQQMCGDSEVPIISYDFYTADEENQLTKEKLELL